MQNVDLYKSRYQQSVDLYEDFNSLKGNDLKLRIDEMLKIKSTVAAELRELEAKRQKLMSDISNYNSKIDELKQELSRQQTELNRLKISVEQAQVAQREAILRNTPELALPSPIYPNVLPRINKPISYAEFQLCKMSNCFDHSRCSITSSFPIFLYDPDKTMVVNQGFEIDGFLKTTIKQTLGYNAHLTKDPKIACIFLVLVGEALSEQEALKNNRYANTIDVKSASNETLNITALQRLPYWGGDGRNHVLMNLARRDLSTGSRNVFANSNTGRAILVQSTFNEFQFRRGYDLIVPPILGAPGGDVWQECSPMLPARRKYLLSFQGEMAAINKTANNHEVEEQSIDEFIISHLSDISNGGHSDKFYLQFECIPATEQTNVASNRDWFLCGTDNSRRAILKDSTFALLLVPERHMISSTLLQARLYEALRAGAIPVILGGDQIELPFSETIEWRRAALFLPKARVTEVHFLLRAVPDSDLLLMRRQGRMLWERYLSTVQATMDTIVASIRDRLGIPPKPVPAVKTQSVFNSSFVPLKSDPVIDVEPEESLGPIEPPYPSPQFRRNYTVFLTQSSQAWNEWGDPFVLYPHLPFDPVLPSDAKFIGSNLGFRPIGKGVGGTGKEFSESLGGNFPREQFTIVILTYEREQVLMDSLGRLYGLPYLHKVIVVWNSARPPLEDLRW